MFDLKQKNLEVLNVRDQLIKENKNFGIKELLKMPPYYDWVKCKVTDSDFFHMFLCGNDDGVAMRFFWNSAYEHCTLYLWNIIAKRVKKDFLILDIGAHTGSYSLAAKTANKETTVVSIEPHIFNVARLIVNLKGNGLKTNNVVSGAISDVNGSKRFSISTKIDYLGSGGSLGEKNGALSTNVNCYSLDSLIPSNNHDKIGLIKIDTEGHEVECLLGAHSILNQSSPIIFFECNTQKIISDLEKIFKSLDYVFFALDDLNFSCDYVEKLNVFYKNSEIDQHKVNRVAIKKNQLNWFKNILDNSPINSHYE
tara:strand:+ start:2784 stop:3713 length:930 start_codon:yes stop_codon:yes gene_type:complete